MYEIVKRCFLCGRPMERVEGRLYDTCTNKKCLRNKPLRDVSKGKEGNKKTPTEEGKA